MSQVITCPNCDKKLALREELKGRAVICPQCQGRFTVPMDGLGEGGDAPSQGASETAGPDMGFLDTLGPATGLPASTGPGVAKTAARPATVPKTAAGKAATPATAARSLAAKAKKKNDQMMLLYIGGGIAAVVLLVIVVAVAMSSGSGSGKKEEKNIRFGLTESQRKRLFKDLISAVDENGSRNQYKEARAEWRRLGGERQLNDQQIEDVFKEGMDHGWEQPEMAATMDQTQKTNRLDFFRTRHLMNRDPVMGR